MEEDYANMLWNILNKAVKDTISYDQRTTDSLTFTIKDFPLQYLESNRQYLYFFSRGGEGYQNFKKMGFTFTRDKRWPHIDINFPCSRTGVDHHLLGIIHICFGRWEEYEMLYSYMTRILNDTNNKSIAVTSKVEIRVNMDLLRTALHAISCTGYIDDKSHFSIIDKEHRCCSYCYEEIAGVNSSIKQVCLMLLIFLISYVKTNNEDIMKYVIVGEYDMIYT